MNFYMNAARALDHLDKHPGSVKGSLAAAGINYTPGEAKRLLAREPARLTTSGIADSTSRYRDAEMYIFSLTRNPCRSA
jgi:hypothetical protein